MSERLYTTEEAAEELDIPARLISQWKHRRKVTPCGLIPRPGAPAPVYRLDELRPLADGYKKRRGEKAGSA